MDKFGYVPSVLESDLAAIRGHPRFLDAVRVACRSLVAEYNGDGLPNRLMNDRGRVIGGLIALYLHFTPAEDGRVPAPGLTASRFEALCVELGLCSPGRARAFLALMRYAGYLAPMPGRSPDRRQRQLIPTDRLIAQHRRRWVMHFEAIALMMPDAMSRAMRVQDRPEFAAAFMRHLGAMYLAGFRPLQQAPVLAGLIERNAGLFVMLSLFLAATDGGSMATGGTAIPVSISALSSRFGIARVHTRRLLKDAVAVGLLGQSSSSQTVTVLPSLQGVVGDLFAAMFALQAHCAAAAVADVSAASANSEHATGRRQESDARAGQEPGGAASLESLSVGGTGR
ncbi:MAG: hypothetical protein JOZ42_09620 [Acetobacteraceae bacterium]|nr:hypothetical protein [Acetobacteraceae bacterium]